MQRGLVTNYNRVPNSLIRSNYNKEVSSIDMSMLYETIARATHDGTYTGAAQGSASGVELGQMRAYRMQDRVNRQQNAFNYECNSNSSKWVIPSVFSIQVQFAISDVGDGISTIKE